MACLFLNCVINSDFAYLFDLDSDGTVHTLNHIISMFDINSIDNYENDISASNDDEPRLVSVSSNMTIKERERFVEILKRRSQAFAFTYEDTPGVDRSIIEHRSYQE